MKKLDLKHHIRLVITENADPKHPVALKKESTKKLAEIPKLLRSLATCYGSTLGEPMLWGATVYVPISDDEDLFGLLQAMGTHLAQTAVEIHENAQRQPPQPLTQAVTHPHCIELLRALAKAYDKSELTTELQADGKAFELPHVSLADFTEPDARETNQTHFRGKVIGLCIPENDANVVLLDNMMLLHMPRSDYPYDSEEIFARVLKGRATYVGPIELVKKDHYRALPGGQLASQQNLL